MHTNELTELNSTKDAQILTMVKQIIPAAFISKHVDNEVHITIPVQTDERHLFVPLFRLLENKKCELGIASYGISDSGLEQVFVKITKSCEDGKIAGTVYTEADVTSNLSFDDPGVDSSDRDYVQLRSVGKCY
jgi:hypothetical protein